MKGARLDEGEPTNTDWLNWLEAYLCAVVDGEEVLPIDAGQADHLRFVLADLRSAGGTPPFVLPVRVAEAPLGPGISPMYRVVTENGAHLSVLLEQVEADYIARAINSFAPAPSETQSREPRAWLLSCCGRTFLVSVGSVCPNCKRFVTASDVEPLFTRAARTPSEHPGEPLGWVVVQHSPNRRILWTVDLDLTREQAEHAADNARMFAPKVLGLTYTVEPVGSAPEGGER